MAADVVDGGTVDDVAGVTASKVKDCDAPGASQWGMTMRVQVVYFGVLKDVFRVDQESVEMADGGSIADLLTSIEQ